MRPAAIFREGFPVHGVRRAVTVSAAVKQGRDAIARRAWARAFRAFARADRARPLDPQDLEHLAVAAYMLGCNDDHLECMKRAHRAHQDARDLPRAARCAFWAGINLAMRGRASHAAGWFGRAQRLAESGPRDNVEHGYLLDPHASRACGGTRLEGRGGCCEESGAHRRTSRRCGSLRPRRARARTCAGSAGPRRGRLATRWMK